MNNRITLPLLLGFRVVGFRPIFKDDVIMKLSGPSVVLGGNSLGKTTIVQAVVYGLTGGNATIEEQKSLRWDHKYFRKRLDLSQMPSAYVEVEFALNKMVMSVRRGFRNSTVLAFRKGRGQRGWIKEPNSAQLAFENALAQYGGYASVKDFGFVVHRLLYLPETRQLLAWDPGAQIRTIMLLNPDVLREEDFRRRREELKQLDSDKRHVRVAINRTVKEIERLQNSKKKLKSRGMPSTGIAQDVVDVKKPISALQAVKKQRLMVQDERQAAVDGLSDISSKIEVLREQIEQVEASLIAASLKIEEKEGSLPLYKMAENGICPACGTRQHALKTLAHQRLENHMCLICGSEEPQQSDPELTTLRSQLAARIASQQELEHRVRIANEKFKRLRREEDRLEYEITRVWVDQSNLSLIERGVPLAQGRDLLKTKSELETREAELEARIHVRQADLERDYKEFRTIVDDRVSRLCRMYELYATDFLGIKCALAETESIDLISITQFIPKFGGIVRDSPQSCSESQRFFLDIAFRMALIDLACEKGKDAATFVCETPETALDISYVDNVVKMFSQFLDRGHSLLLTANIQRDGIAGKILNRVNKKQRTSHVLNLLDIGRLSDVHKRALPKLRGAVRKMLG